jgi:hypothetical protein
VNGGAKSLGARVCSGSPLAIEWFEQVSTSSSIGGLVRSSTLALWEKESEPLLWLFRVESILRIAEGSGEPTPFMLTRMLYPARLLILVRCDHLVSPALLVLLLHAP